MLEWVGSIGRGPHSDCTAPQKQKHLGPCHSKVSQNYTESTTVPRPRLLGPCKSRGAGYSSGTWLCLLQTLPSHLSARAGNTTTVQQEPLVWETLKMGRSPWETEHTRHSGVVAWQRGPTTGRRIGLRSQARDMGTAELQPQPSWISLAQARASHQCGGFRQGRG